MTLFANVRQLEDEALIGELHRWTTREQLDTAWLIAHLAEVDARGLFREYAFPSMFQYTVEELRLSEAEAFLRIYAARLSRRFPHALEMLAKGELNLTTIKLLGPHLTQSNHRQLLERAKRRRKRQVELLVAEIAPMPDVPERVRKLPARATEFLDDFRTSDATPLRIDRYKFQFTGGRSLHDKVAHARELLRHQVPDGDLAILVERGMDRLIEHALKQRFAQTSQPRGTEETRSNSRYVPRAVLRDVYQRDDGQCTFVSTQGRRCSERGYLELHHETPYARGGPTTTANLRLVCRAHNALFAERDFGKAFMQSKHQAKYTTQQFNEFQERQQI